VPVERAWPAGPGGSAIEVTFIDLPGIAANDRVALSELAAKLAVWPNVQIHLVLNGAYESATLLAQARAFATLPVTDLIVTHLDEEQRWGKLWNLALGTNFSLRFLCAGQNIPGDFQIASAEKILARQFPCK
jgi:flagellar biosynthesis protein FlhF